MRVITQEKFTVYAMEGDMTFIMQETYEDGDLKCTECVGWHYGEPDKDSIESFSGSMKAIFTEE